MRSAESRALWSIFCDLSTLDGPYLHDYAFDPLLTRCIYPIVRPRQSIRKKEGPFETPFSVIAQYCFIEPYRSTFSLIEATGMLIKSLSNLSLTLTAQ